MFFHVSGAEKCSQLSINKFQFYYKQNFAFSQRLKSLEVKKRERHPRPKPKAALPHCYRKVFKMACLHPLNQRGKPTWEITRAAPGKAATGEKSAHFRP